MEGTSPAGGCTRERKTSSDRLSVTRVNPARRVTEIISHQRMTKTMPSQVLPAELAPPLERLERERDDFCQQRIQFWEDYGDRLDSPSELGGSFYRRKIRAHYCFLVPPGQKVLELGCGRGDLLAVLEPREGVGVDWSPAILHQARHRHPHLRFVQADVHDLMLDEKFDVIILSDLISDLWDIQEALENIRPLMAAHTKIILNFHNRAWRIPLRILAWLGLARPAMQQNWLTPEDVVNLLELVNLEPLYQSRELLWPLPTWGLEPLFNRVLARLWPFCYSALSNFVVAKPQAARTGAGQEPMVSVVIPARNEAGNIDEIFRRLPEMGQGTELIFVEGHSTDNTYAAIEAAIDRHPERNCRLLRQSGKGKGDAVRLGFEHARGDILMILDADLTVPPEWLPRFYDALVSGKGEFINGVRLVYPLQQQAMQFLNLLANRFFGLAFTWLIGRPIRDTLCGTKVLWKDDYRKISDNRQYFGDLDPFGDFDLLFGAAKLKLKIIDMPVRYGSRTYGTTNIQRRKHGWLLLRMAWLAARRLKFV